MLDSSGSEDEFPDVKEIVRRHKTSNNNNKSILSTTSSSTTTKSSSITNNAPRLLAQDHNNNINNNKENLLPPSPKPQLKATSMSPMKGQATPGMRRRKLGLAQSQAVDGSLFGRWEGGGSGDGPAPQTARKAATGSRARMIREASVATASTTTTTAEDHSSISNTNTNNNNSIMSFGSAVTAGTTNTSSSRTARTLFRKKSRPRLEIDDSFDEEDEDDAVVSRRKARSVRPPTRFRDMLKATQPVSGLDSDSDSNDNDNDGSDFALGKSSAGEGEDSSEFDSFGQRSRGDSSRSTLDSELFSTPPKRRTAKPPGTARRVLRPAKTAASVDPMLGRKEPATSRKPSRSVSAKGGAAAPPPKERRGKTPAAAAGSKAAKQDGLEDAFQKLKM